MKARVRIVMAMFALVCGVVQAGAHQDESIAEPAASDALAVLRELAQREAEAPTDTLGRAPAPGGIDTDLAPELRDAGRALDEWIAELAEEMPDPPVPAATNPEDELDAQRLYVAGRMKSLDGDFADAIRDLSTAATLVPAQPDVWLALAEAQSAQGLRTAAIGSLDRAVRLGLRNPDALFNVARERARMGEHRDAARMLAAAWSNDAAHADPALGFVVMGELSAELRALGAQLAASQAAERALDLPERFSEVTRFRMELAALLREAPELRRQTGDTYLRLGRPVDALRAYTIGAPGGLTQTPWPANDLPRIVLATVRAGMPATAGLVVLEPVAEGHAALGEQRRELLVYLAEHAGLRTPLVEAIGSLAGDASVAPTDAARLTLARAAVAGVGDGGQVLAEAIAADPDRVELVDALLGEADSDADRVAVAAALARTNPNRTDLYAARLLASVQRNPDVLDVEVHTDSERLVRAYAALGLGHYGEATGSLDALDPEAPGAALADALIGAQLGDWDRVERGLERTPGDSIARVRALRAAQRFEDAADAAERLLEDGESSLVLRIGLAEILIELGRADDAVRHLRDAIAEDRADPRAYEGLLAIYGPEGQLTDSDAQAQVLQELRDAAPGAQTIRLLSARALAEQGLLAEAERRLTALLDDPDAAPAALATLTQVWRAWGRSEPEVLDRALEMLDTRLLKNPWDDAAETARTTILMELGRPGEAEQLLAARLERGPSVSLSRLREELIRTALGDGARADEMTIARLEAAPPNIDNSLSLAAALAEADPAGARAAFERAFAPEVTFTLGQQRAAAFAMSRVLRVAMRDSDDDAAVAGLAMLERARAAQLALPWDTWHDALHVEASQRGATTETLVDLAGHVLERIESPELARAVVGLYTNDPPPAIATLDELRAELAYRFAATLYAEGHEDASIAVYRLALSYDAAHAWANNDLGYFLVERGESLAEAETLLEHAYAARPDEASIVDSLAWLRYRLGALDDQPGREGAVTLLRRATTELDGRSNATILDHFGDALYRSGDHAGATNAWNRARAAARREVNAMPAGVPSLVRERAEEELVEIEAKLEALEGGEEPAIAPLLEGEG